MDSVTKYYILPAFASAAMILAGAVASAPEMPAVTASPVIAVQIMEVAPNTTREIAAPTPTAAPVEFVEVEPLHMEVATPLIAVEGEAIIDSFTVAEVNYSDKQEYCLARNIYFEARNQTVEGMEAVALVTLNRVASKRYPDTICKVVWQRKQFSWTQDGKSDTPHEKLAWKIAKDVAASVLENYNTAEYDFTNGAMWYHANYVKPKWRNTMTQTATIGAHIFYAKG